MFLIIVAGVVGLVEGLVWGHSFVRFRPSYVGSSRQRRLRCLTAGAAIIYGRRKSVDVCFAHALNFFIAAPFLGAGVCCALIVRCAFWFCALMRGLCPRAPASLLARGLTARFVSLAFYPQLCSSHIFLIYNVQTFQQQVIIKYDISAAEGYYCSR